MFHQFIVPVPGVHCLSLDGVSIPPSHPGGQDLTLSCDYSYTLSESDQIVLHWYHNGSPIPIYQWVPALDMGPQVIHELFKDNLDLTYEAHDDKFKKHSTLTRDFLGITSAELLLFCRKFLRIRMFSSTVSCHLIFHALQVLLQFQQPA